MFVTLRNALDMHGLKRSVESLQTEVESRYEIVGSSPRIHEMLMRIEKVAPTRARVLITGEKRHGKGAEWPGRSTGCRTGATGRSWK